MSSKFNWDSYEDSTPSKGKFDWSEYETVKAPKGKLEKTARVAAQVGLGALDTALFPLTVAGHVIGSQTGKKGQYRDTLSKEVEQLSQKKQNGPLSKREERALSDAQKVLTKLGNNPEEDPKKLDLTPSGLVKQGVKKVTGYDLEPEGFAEKAGEFAGAFGPKQIVSGLKNIKNILPKAETQKLSSGLTKPKALESKLSKFAITTPAGHEKAIEKINKEAAALTRKSVETHLPISKKIEEGFEFGKDFERKFGALKNTAKANNINLNISPIESLLHKTQLEYKGIPKLHEEAKKVMAEINAFSKDPQSHLESLLKIFRSNNQKLNSIHETKLVSGRQADYSKFLNEFNKAITETFEKNLGKESPFVSAFKEANNEYAQYSRAKDTLKALEPILRGEASLKNLEKLAYDARGQKQLALKLGEQGAREISTISKDLIDVRKAFEKFSKKEFSHYESALPLTLFIPGTHGIAPIVGAYHAHRFARRGLGWILSRPETRRDYSTALKALKNGDKKGFASASLSLKKSLDEQKD